MVAIRLSGALAAALLCSGCSTSQTPAETPASSTLLPGVTDMAGFTLTSPSFSEGGAIPEKHSCDGSDLSPALDWVGAPTGTAVFALIVDDPDANGFVHWVAFNIAGGSGGSGGGLAEAIPPSGPPEQGRNGFGRTGYGGPCPPSGTHHYRFTLFALSQPLALRATPSASDVRAALATGVLLGQATLTATYTRKK
jgi:Raf kinase inhibitor-like YbhB/YbcL family protein